MEGTLQERMLAFDPKTYAMSEDEFLKKPISPRMHKIEVGKMYRLVATMISNGATEEELERAAKHSEVVLNSRKYFLDYKKSEKDFGIKELEEKYQPEVFYGFRKKAKENED